jgi:hypothetical protein
MNASQPEEPLDPIRLKMMNLYKELLGELPFRGTGEGYTIGPEVPRYDERFKPGWWEQKPEELVYLFTRRLMDIGIKRCLLFPQVMMRLSELADPDLQVAIANAYVDCMLDKYLGKYPGYFHASMFRLEHLTKQLV